MEVWKFGPMWQSYVEIKDYSVIYFNRVTAFKALYHRTSIKGEAHMHFVDRLDICMILPLTEVQRYGASNTAMRSK